MTKPRHPLEQAPRKEPPPPPPKPGEQIYLKRRFVLTMNPLLTYALIVINVALFALPLLLPEAGLELMRGWVNDPQRVAQQGEYYRLFTAMFLHLDMTHLLFNMLALYWIGQDVERQFGHWRYALIYLLGGLGGSVASMLFNEGGLGASGAVFAIWGADLVHLLRNRAAYGPYINERIRSSLIVMGLNFFVGFFVNAYNETTGNSNIRIGNIAHIGGFIAGMIFAYVLTPVYRVKWVKTPGKQDAVQVEQVNPPQKALMPVLLIIGGLFVMLFVAVMLRS